MNCKLQLYCVNRNFKIRIMKKNPQIKMKLQEVIIWKEQEVHKLMKEEMEDGFDLEVAFERARKRFESLHKKRDRLKVNENGPEGCL